jgi:hypothetical protein
MRDVLRQLQKEFPDIETIAGMRVSGARDKAGTWQTKGIVEMPLRSASEADLKNFRYFSGACLGLIN